MTTKTKAQIEQLNNRRGNGQFDTKQYSESNISLDNPLLTRTSADSVYASVHANPDDKLEEFCDLNPDLPPGKARSILHQFAKHLEHHPASTRWEETMSTRIAEDSVPTHPSLVMSPDEGTVQDLSREVFVANQMDTPEEVLRSKLEFHGKVPHLDADEADSAFDASLALLKIDHEDWKKPLQDAAREDAVAAGHDFDYSYTPPGSRSSPGTYSEKTVGNLYVQNQSLADINKDMRAELNRAQKAGYLPRGIGFSVKKGGRGSSMISINVKGVDEESAYNPDQVWGRKSSPLGAELTSRVEGIANSWNWDDSDPYADYSNYRYFANVNLRD